MEVKDAKLGQAVFFVSDEYDEDLRINRPILLQGTVIGVYEDSESIQVEWKENPTDEEDEQGDCFFFPTKEEAVAEYIHRHTEDLVQQAIMMERRGV